MALFMMSGASTTHPDSSRFRGINHLTAAEIQPCQQSLSWPASTTSCRTKRTFRMAETVLQHREDALGTVQDAMLRLARNYRNHPAEEWVPLSWSILRRGITDQYRHRKIRSIMMSWLQPPIGDNSAPCRIDFCPAKVVVGTGPPQQRQVLQQRWREMSPADRDRWLPWHGNNQQVGGRSQWLNRPVSIRSNLPPEVLKSAHLKPCGIE